MFWLVQDSMFGFSSLIIKHSKMSSLSAFFWGGKRTWAQKHAFCISSEIEEEQIHAIVWEFMDSEHIFSRLQLNQNAKKTVWPT